MVLSVHFSNEEPRSFPYGARPPTEAALRSFVLNDEGQRAVQSPVLRNHLNCGTVGTVMRGGGSGATPAFFIPLGLTGIFPNAPRVAGFGRAPPTPPECPIPAEPPPRANDAAGKAKTMKKTKATFTKVFDMRKLHLRFTRTPVKLT